MHAHFAHQIEIPIKRNVLNDLRPRYSNFCQLTALSTSSETVSNFLNRLIYDSIDINCITLYIDIFDLSIVVYIIKAAR